MSASSGVLVRPVALDAGEAQGDAAGVAGGGLDAVERDLDDELRTHEHRDSLTAGLALEQLLRLPLEQLVGQSLEALADHDEVARARIAGAEVEVREPALPAAVAPFGTEHDEVVRPHRLDLAPAPCRDGPPRTERWRPSRPRLRGRPAATRRGRARPSSGSDVMTPGILSCGAIASSLAARSCERRVEQVVAVGVQHVEQERHDPLRRRARCRSARRCPGRRPGRRRPSTAPRRRAPPADGQAPHRVDDSRQRIA